MPAAPQSDFCTSLARPLRDVLSLFIRQHERIYINIAEDNRSMLLSLHERSAIDVAFVLGEAAYQNYAYLSLWSERIMVALPKARALAQREFVYWTDMKGERFLMSQSDPGPETQNILFNKLSS
ncbi:LysR substrate-binding domain-containing protein [Pseudorhodoplanes sp.]|uniref:LysR substrate-binding domain-containing protein n=1 Tax=Pseudorhodoplanes sp. TaxID=1934341 RepID=UPI003D133305